MVKIKNLILGLKGQLPIKRAFRNFFITGNAWGMFSKQSHIRKDGKLKQSFPTVDSANKSAQQMSKKHKKHFSVYKCVHCDGFHLGKNRDNK